MNRKIFLLVVALLTTFSASADNYQTGGIYYDVIWNPGKQQNEADVISGAVKYSGDITIPASFVRYGNRCIVTSIRGNAFRDCTELNSVTIPSISVRQGAFGGCTGLTAIYGSYATEDNRCWIDNGVLIAFAPAGLTEFAIPDGVTSVGQYVFYNCTDLQTISIPEGVTEIGAYAFTNCTGLTSITIPEGVTKIGESAFAGCSNLMMVTISESVTSIGNSAFKDCTDITVNLNATNCTTIGSFKDGPVLEGCTNATLNIGNNVQTLPSMAFCNSDGLTSLTIGTGLQTIPSSAFEGCTSLTDVKIPDTVSEINSSAFGGCTSLSSITVENDNPASITLGTTVFASVPKESCTLYVPAWSQENYAAAAQWKDFLNIIEFDDRALIDGNPYTLTVNHENVDLQYIRTFEESCWQPLYVPYNMGYTEWSKYADVAELYNVRSLDNNNDGVIDDVIIEFNKLTSGELVPNVPYIIKPKTTGEVTFEESGKNLMSAPTSEGSVECSSTKEVFTLYGVYQAKSFATPAAAPARLNAATGTATYHMVDGEFVPTESTTEIPSGSIYLTISPKSGGYNTPKTPDRVRIHVKGEPLPTAIETITTDTPADDIYYDLMGRPVANPTSGLYIVSGRKVLVK